MPYFIPLETRTNGDNASLSTRFQKLTHVCPQDVRGVQHRAFAHKPQFTKARRFPTEARIDDVLEEDKAQFSQRFSLTHQEIGSDTPLRIHQRRSEARHGIVQCPHRSSRGYRRGEPAESSPVHTTWLNCRFGQEMVAGVGCQAEFAFPRRIKKIEGEPPSAALQRAAESHLGRSKGAVRSTRLPEAVTRLNTKPAIRFASRLRSSLRKRKSSVSDWRSGRRFGNVTGASVRSRSRSFSASSMATTLPR